MNAIRSIVVIGIFALAACSQDDYGDFSEVDICKAVLSAEYPDFAPKDMDARAEYGSVFISYQRPERPLDRFECYISGGNRVMYKFAHWDQYVLSREFYYDTTTKEGILAITVVDEYGSRHANEFTLADFRYYMP